MSIDRWTITFIIAVLLTGILSWQSFKRYQVMACVEGGGHWDKTSAKCRDRRILIHRDIYRT
jgi:hypothetical protein